MKRVTLFLFFIAIPRKPLRSATWKSSATTGVSLILAPQFAGRAFMIMAGPAFIAETSFAVWLIKGVRIERWSSLTS